MATNVTVTTGAVYIPEWWASEVLYATINTSVLAPIINTSYSALTAKAGDKVHIPEMAALTINDKVANTAVTYQANTETKKTITLDKNKYWAVRIEDIAELQSDTTLSASYAYQGGRGIAKTIDTDVSALIDDTTVTQNVGATTSAVYQDIDDAVIREANKILDEQNCPDSGRILVISPEQKSAMLAINKFVSVDTIGGGNMPVTTGLFGMIYGVKVYISNNLKDVAVYSSVSAGDPLVNAHKSCGLFHESALALVMQREHRVQADHSIDYLAWSIVGDTVYGIGVVRPSWVVQVRTTTEA